MKKISKIIKKPSITLLSWIVFLFSPLLDVVRLKYISIRGSTGINFGLFADVLFYLPFLISFFVFLMMTTWFIDFIKGKLNRHHYSTLVSISVLSVFFLMVAQYLINLDYIHYPNYLYQLTGLTSSRLNLTSFIVGIELVFYTALLIFRDRRFDYKFKSIVNSFPFFISLMGLFSMIVLSGSTLFHWRTLYNGSFEGYEGKVGEDYKYIHLLASETESSKDVVVIHPPQGDKWPAIGNQPVLRYFLYPRTLISGVLIDNKNIAKNIGSAYFVQIDFNGKNSWPIIDVSKNLVYFNEKDGIHYSSLKIFFENDVGKIFLIKF